MINEETGKVEFNETEQAEVNRIIGERLSREGIQDMKEIMEHLKPFGYTGTPAEIKAAIKADADDFVNQLRDSEKKETLEQLQQQAEKTGTTPELLATIKALQEDLSEIKGKSKAAQDAENQRIAAQKMQDEQIRHFAECEDTKDIDLKKLNENPKFLKFLSKQKQTGEKDGLVEAYKDYVELIGDVEAETIAKIQANGSRSSSSGRGSGDPTGGTFGLTANQQELAKENGLTNKEYAEMLKHIKKG